MTDKTLAEKLLALMLDMLIALPWALLAGYRVVPWPLAAFCSGSSCVVLRYFRLAR